MAYFYLVHVSISSSFKLEILFLLSSTVVYLQGNHPLIFSIHYYWEGHRGRDLRDLLQRILSEATINRFSGWIAKCNQMRLQILSNHLVTFRFPVGYLSLKKPSCSCLQWHFDYASVVLELWLLQCREIVAQLGGTPRSLCHATSQVTLLQKSFGGTPFCLLVFTIILFQPLPNIQDNKQGYEQKPKWR